jgi:chitinase domain-containing protein 1
VLAEIKYSKTSLSERNLISETISSKKILGNYQKLQENRQREFNGKTLGYITPWHHKGKEMAKLFHDRFDYFSPCWFTVGSDGVVKGDHDIDAGWLNEMRDIVGDDGALILPRYNLVGLSNMKDWKSFFDNIDEFVKSIKRHLKNHGFKGLVLDGGHMTASINNFREELLNFLVKFGNEMKKDNYVVGLVLSPYVAAEQSKGFVSSDLIFIADHFDFFNIMSYDFSKSTGPNSPMQWHVHIYLQLVPPEKRAELSSKIIMGIPFYGYDWDQSSNSPEAIINHKYLELLKEHKPDLVWDEQAEEHRFTYKSKYVDHTVYYPTPKFLDSRIKFYKSVGCGIGIWELGQGLEYFFDLL